MFSYMKTYCSICRGDMDGMKRYGKEAHCCSKECFDEWKWRETLAIMGRQYKPKPKEEEPLTERTR